MLDWALKQKLQVQECHRREQKATARLVQMVGNSQAGRGAIMNYEFVNVSGIHNRHVWRQEICTAFLAV